MRISDWSSDVCSSDLVYGGCPAATTLSTTSGNQSTATTTSWASCSMVAVGNAGCKGTKVNYYPRGTKTVRTVVQPTATHTTRTPMPGRTAACFNTSVSSSQARYTCNAPRGYSERQSGRN